MTLCTEDTAVLWRCPQGNIARYSSSGVPRSPIALESMAPLLLQSVYHLAGVGLYEGPREPLSTLQL